MGREKEKKGEGEGAFFLPRSIDIQTSFMIVEIMMMVMHGVKSPAF